MEEIVSHLVTGYILNGRLIIGYIFHGRLITGVVFKGRLDTSFQSDISTQLFEICYDSNQDIC